MAPQPAPQRRRHPLQGARVCAARAGSGCSRRTARRRRAGQRHRHPAPRQPRDQRRRHLRGVGEGFVEHRRQFRHHRQRVGAADIEFGVVAAQMGGHFPGQRRLVVVRALEADAEAVHRLRALRLHHRSDEGRIGAAGQEHAHRHVSHHAQRHRLPQRPVQHVGGLGLAAGERRGQAGGHALARVPVRPLRLRGPVRGGAGRHRDRVQVQYAARHQLEGAFVDAVRRGDIVQPQQQGQRIAVDAVVERRMPPQRLQLGTEHQRVAGPAVVQRLLADAVAGQRQALLAAVPQGDGEHAVAAPQRGFQPPLHDRRQQHLGIGMAAEAVAVRFQLGAQRGEVVDLAVVGQPVAAVAGGHRLMAQRRQVQDAQPPVRQRHAGGGIGPDAAVIRSTMGQGIAHRAGQRRQFRFLQPRLRLQDSRQSTHTSRYPRASSAAALTTSLSPGSTSSAAPASGV